MKAQHTKTPSPLSWKAPKALRARINKALKHSGLRYSELAEIAISRVLDEAGGARGLIDIKLRYNAAKQEAAT